MKNLNAQNSLKCKINIDFFHFKVSQLPGRGGGPPVGTKSQLFPFFCMKAPPSVLCDLSMQQIKPASAKCCILFVYFGLMRPCCLPPTFSLVPLSCHFGLYLYFLTCVCVCICICIFVFCGILDFYI